MRCEIAARRAGFSGHTWRALAIASSISALALTVAAKPARHVARSLMPKPAASAQRARPSIDPTPALSGGPEPARTNPREEPDALDLGRRFSDATDSELPQLAHALAELGGAGAYAVLIRATQSTRISARGAAREAIASLDTPEARSFMLAELSGPDDSKAVAYFTDCVDPRAIPVLEQLARDSDADSRRAAIAALFAQGDSARPAIMRLLQDDPEVSDDVLEVPASNEDLRRMQRTAAIQRLRAGAVTSGYVFDFLARDLSIDARRALVESARDSASVEHAIDALTTRGDFATLSTLSNLAEDSDLELAGRAACALLSAPDSRSLPFLLRAERKSPGEAATALLRIAAPEADAALDRRRALEEAAARREAEAPEAETVELLEAQSHFGS